MNHSATKRCVKSDTLCVNRKWVIVASPDFKCFKMLFKQWLGAFVIFQPNQNQFKPVSSGHSFTFHLLSPFVFTDHLHHLILKHFLRRISLAIFLSLSKVYIVSSSKFCSFCLYVFILGSLLSCWVLYAVLLSNARINFKDFKHPKLIIYKGRIFNIKTL